MKTLIIIPTTGTTVPVSEYSQQLAGCLQGRTSFAGLCPFIIEVSTGLDEHVLL
jgi:hypothetical protein